MPRETRFAVPAVAACGHLHSRRYGPGVLAPRDFQRPGRPIRGGLIRQYFAQYSGHSKLQPWLRLVVFPKRAAVLDSRSFGHLQAEFHLSMPQVGALQSCVLVGYMLGQVRPGLDTSYCPTT